MGYIYIFGCIFFTVYGQLILKWRLSLKGAMPADLTGMSKSETQPHNEIR